MKPSMLGSTAEADEYRRWASTRGYRVELAALILAEEGAHDLPGKTAPNGDDYRLAAEIVNALDGPLE